MRLPDRIDDLGAGDGTCFHVPLRGDGRGGFADDAATRRRELGEFVAAAPPHLTELLEAPSWRVAEVLRKRA